MLPSAPTALDARASEPLRLGKPRVLYANDATVLREEFVKSFSRDFDVTCVRSGAEALEALGARDYDVVVGAVCARSRSGQDLLASVRESFPDVPRIGLLSLVEHDALAEFVRRSNVFAYVVEPWDRAQLGLLMRRATELRRAQLENRRLTSELRASNVRSCGVVEAASKHVVPTSRPRLLATSPAMQHVMAQVLAVAATDASVLLIGETGTGKELVAAEIHERSDRRRARFVAQNLAALPPELMASELFGHVKGAFTGAQQSRRGLFELADGGTLFLDEIGEAPMPLQALLLRALESHEFWPVGASEPRHVDVRIVAATNRNLLADAQEQLFRLDLYYRLAVCPIEVLPLRARPEDVRGIGAPLLEAAARRMNRRRPRITEAAWRVLEAHPWPGNVRELGNVMERLVIYCAGRDIEPRDLGLLASPYQSDSSFLTYGRSLVPECVLSESPHVHASRRTSEDVGESRGPTVSRAPYASRGRTHAVPPLLRGEATFAASPGERDEATPRSRMDVGTAVPRPLSLDLPEGGTTFDELEREILVQVLARADHNQSRAARSLGMSESTFRSRMKRLGMKG